MNAMPKLRPQDPKVNLSDAEAAQLREAIRQRDAIFRLEGFEPTDEIRAIDEAALAGRVTHGQAVEEMMSYFRQYKTLDGFIQSRIWA
ncbi:MAG: antitoxin VbhA family protein [Rhodocyclaceae bacterium]|nr:antitoxin VbhA family protein [Rhodocyclaceae bacterium]